MTNNFDLVVIGGGPAGVSAAAGAGFLGKRAALVEMAGRLGGAGINTGTIPSKTLRETSLMLSGWRSRRLLGVDLSLRRAATIGDFMRHEENVTGSLRDQAQRSLGDRGVTRFYGAGVFLDPNRILVTHDGEQTIVSGDHILVATGSLPVRPPEFDFADGRIQDSDEILQLRDIPKKLVVIGGGVIGSEYAGTFAALGVEVHLVDGRDTLMPFLDWELSRGLAAAMAKNGITFHWKEMVIQCDTSNPEGVVLTLSSGATLTCDCVLVCAGRQSATADLNLEAAGITAGRRGLLPVNQYYQTVVPHIYATGDVIGAPALAATGIEQSRVAVAHAFDSTFKSDIARVLPTGIYTIPEAGTAGETEAALREKGVDFVVGRAQYDESARGKIIGDDTGFLKLLFRRDDMRLLGVHVMGEQATELVHIGLVALLAEAGADLFNRACFNYPTLGDLYKYATYDALAQREQIA